MGDVKQPKYKRVLLKLSGEALAKDVDGIYNHGFIDEIAQVVKKCIEAGVEIGVVVGAVAFRFLCCLIDDNYSAVLPTTCWLYRANSFLCQ